jgi:hypothetical protein
MPTFRQWFASSVLVGPYPRQTELEGDGRLASYEVLINVSDEYHVALAQMLLTHGKQAHWFPLGEFWGLSLSSIYGALVILGQAELAQQRVYLHCHAGVNRSQTVADCYYFLRTGKHRPRRAWAKGPQTLNALQRNCDHQALLPLAHPGKAQKRGDSRRGRTTRAAVNSPVCWSLVPIVPFGPRPQQA